MDDWAEMYKLEYMTEDGTKTTVEFEATDLWQLGHHLLRFVNLCDFDYIDMLEFSSETGEIYRAEVL